jgi:hypothetical protein
MTGILTRATGYTQGHLHWCWQGVENITMFGVVANPGNIPDRYKVFSHR